MSAGTVVILVSAGLALVSFWAWMVLKVIGLEKDIAAIKAWQAQKIVECRHHQQALTRIDEKLSTVAETTAAIRAVVCGGGGGVRT